MTTKQITNNLKKAGFKAEYFKYLTISRDEVEVFVPSVHNSDHANDESTEEIVRNLSRVLNVVAVMTTGCGSKIVELTNAGNVARRSNELDHFGAGAA